MAPRTPKILTACHGWHGPDTQLVLLTTLDFLSLCLASLTLEHAKLVRTLGPVHLLLPLLDTLCPRPPNIWFMCMIFVLCSNITSSEASPEPSHANSQPPASFYFLQSTQCLKLACLFIISFLGIVCLIHRCIFLSL